ncbi:MAG TPA: lysylphosphatidylglycerol synthase transmembrane domain-containing protein [Gaiellaceae bacterium]|nr:lysylphosphatidylglycerol synthase transmembrane domain-containing protein [Gaiellaceae bacterium]
MSRPVRVAATLLLTGLAVAYLVWKIDVGKTADVLADTSAWWFLLAVAIMTLTVVPMAERWRRLLESQGMRERLPWLTRAYLVSYTAGQILPTSIGGDAVRIVETSRRHPARLGAVSAIVLLERALGGAATVLLGAVGFVLAIGRYDVGAYLWVEGAFVLGTFVLAFLFFSRSARPLLRLTTPLLSRIRLERPVRAVYDGVHAFRERTGLLLGLFAFTVAIQAVRVLAIWAAARAVGIDLSPRIYYVMGPLFFLVLLVPFTLNGFAVREAFFVSFLGGVGVGADAAFAAGFLFFLVTVAMALPGGAILLWEGLRGKPTPTHA